VRSLLCFIGTSMSFVPVTDTRLFACKAYRYTANVFYLNELQAEYSMGRNLLCIITRQEI
jgi:hypothetical protein